MNLTERVVARLRNAQAVPGMEKADPEFAPMEEHEVFAPGFARFQKVSLKREVLKRIDELREFIATDHWYAAWEKVGVVRSMIQGMKNYMEGKTPIMYGEEYGTAEKMAKSAIIRHENSKWNLYSHTGRLLGSHPTKEKAVKQEQAIEIAKHAQFDTLSWPYYDWDPETGFLYDEDGYKAFDRKFSSAMEAEEWLEKEDLRGNVRE